MINFLVKHLQLLYTWNLLFQQKSFHYLAFLFIHLQLTSFHFLSIKMTMIRIKKVSPPSQSQTFIWFIF